MKPSFSIPSFRSRVEGAALLAVVALLGVLAVLQHRWLEAIAEGERRQLHEEAEQKSATIAQDIDRELTRAFFELRVDAKALDQGGGPAFAERLDRWRRESAHAGLLRGVYVADRGAEGPSRLRRFDEARKAFVDEPWPDILAGVKDSIDAGADSPLPFPVSLSPGFPPVQADVPALVSPVMNVIVDRRTSDPSGGQSPKWMAEVRELSMRHSSRASVEILLLDPAYLREGLVAATVVSKLGLESPFAWSVRKVSDGTFVTGAPVASNHPGEPDAQTPLLRLRLDDLDRSLLRGVLPGLSEAVTESSMRFVIQVGSPGTTPHTAALAASTGAGPWTLSLRHKEGSIDAAVRARQRRNTALSASILGVLGMSAGLVFFSSRRLREIAARQVEFVASVSHELRTPLAVIRSAADNLADGVVQDAGQSRRYGALIRDESVRLADMVEHVLEFAGADSPARAARGPIDAAEAARAAIKSMEALANERGARVAFESRGDDLKVSGDMSHLTRAVANLLGNAIKYGGDTPRVVLRVERQADGVEITVGDEGPGLEPSEMSRLFEPFYRGDRAREAQIPGSGLGLALVRSIIEGHGGRVSASNGAGGGALFKIVLPAL